MKLELKHLAPYLPYNVVVCVNDFKVVNVKPIHKLHTNEGVGNINHILTSDRYRLSLRPLSDLVKEIEHNGETFVPIEKIKNMWGYKTFEYQGSVSYAHYFKLENNEPAILHLPYCFIELFLEWHFDIYGLIEKGLAIEKQQK